MVKSLPAMQENQVPSLVGEDPLEKEMTTHSSILAWRISWTEYPSGLQSMVSPRVGHNLVIKPTYLPKLITGATCFIVDLNTC